MSAYACEGGVDGRHQPATCYSPTIALGRHPGPGAGDGLWESYETVLDLAARQGVFGVSLEVSWARLEPRRGHRDVEALARYQRAIDFARGRGLHVGVVLIDAAWPAWLGQEAWLMPWVVPVTIDYVDWLTSSLEADSWDLFAERERLTAGFSDQRAGPPWRHGAREDERSAQANLEAIDEAARHHAVAWARSIRVELDDVDDVARLPLTRPDVDEVHVRSLVRGAGPLAGARGLLARRGENWVVVGNDVPAQLRRP
jgi:beta-glucosidase/6-phospho-beta-glucosidase/beta-galactosidase